MVTLLEMRWREDDMMKLFKWLMPKPQKFLFKVTYCTGALVEKDKVTFDTRWVQEIYVAATDLLDAGVAFAKLHTLTPHMYVHKIEKCCKTISQNSV